LKKSRKSNYSIPSAADVRIPLMICVIIGIFFLATYTVLASLTDLPQMLIGISVTVVYIYIAVFVFLSVRNKLRKVRVEEEKAEAMNTEISQLFREVVDLPYVIISEAGSVVIANDALTQIIGHPVAPGSSLKEFCSGSPDSIINPQRKSEEEELLAAPTDKFELPAEDGVQVSIRRRQFRAVAYPMAINSHACHMIVFNEITALVKLHDKMRRENTVVAFVILDNLEELTQYVRVSYRSAANEIETILKNWAEGLGGILREYDRDKYMLMLSQEKLEECIKNKFEILEKVRQIRLGDDSMAVTISMGIYAGSGTLAHRESEAFAALDLALQRGGDQVAIRRGGPDTEFFGGRSKSFQKRTRVRSRVNSARLCAKIAESSNVLIMGHKNPDFDCIGACIGIARLAEFCGVPARIISDKSNNTWNLVYNKLNRNGEYTDLFTDPLSGLDMVENNTLLVICDANNFNIIEAPDIAESVDRIAIIDHHRQTAKFDFEPLVSYIDPAASSACELVAEMLEHSMPSGNLTRDEAEAMLAGIMLDTKHFAKDTSPRTFAAALYLQNEGAKPEVARQYFAEDISEYIAEAKFNSNVEFYRGNIAITRSEGSGNPGHDRIAASKAADKLLTVRQVDAAFALVAIDGSVRISARSADKINVQLILEKLGGGGHFDAAAAQINNTMDEVYSMLKSAIDDYLDNKKTTA